MKPSLGNPFNDWTKDDVQSVSNEQKFQEICSEIRGEYPELTKRDIFILLGLGILVTIGWAVANVIAPIN